MNRREFIKLGAVGTGAALTGLNSLPAKTTGGSKPPVMVAMPISVATLAKGDLDTIFEDMRTRAGVNTLFPFIYSHEPHRAGVEADDFHGGNYAQPHMQYYHDTPLTQADMRAPEFGDVDVLERVIPVAKKHGIRTFCFLLEDNSLPAAVAQNWEPLYEVDHHDRRTKGHPGGGWRGRASGANLAGGGHRRAGRKGRRSLHAGQRGCGGQGRVSGWGAGDYLVPQLH